MVILSVDSLNSVVFITPDIMRGVSLSFKFSILIEWNLVREYIR